MAPIVTSSTEAALMAATELALINETCERYTQLSNRRAPWKEFSSFVPTQAQRTPLTYILCVLIIVEEHTGRSEVYSNIHYNPCCCCLVPVLVAGRTQWQHEGYELHA
jgi:hypothetical protein